MKLTFIGADHEVTGSCHLLQACGKNILVDYGMEQGADYYENIQIPVPAADVDYVLLTHAHIDHSGLLPLLYKQGFKGAIMATQATIDLCNIMLLDSAHIQESEAEWKNRKGRRSGAEIEEAIYTMEDAQGVLQYFVPCEYKQIIELCDGISIEFIDVGHLLGSASIEVWIKEEEIEKKLVFSGDIGNVDQPLIKNPEYLDSADYVIMESTYGDRYHEPNPDYVKNLAQIIQETFEKGGNLVIPCFAVGRTQEMLYFIRQIKEEHMVKNFEQFQVFVDSPLAIEATNIFNENETIENCFDKEAVDMVHQGINPISFPGLKLSISVEESKSINADNTPKIIISASGMCEAGRIRHHLKHNLWREECTILFAGYQAIGSLGRNIIEGAKMVRLFGEEIQVRARIEELHGVSGHADKAGLLKWITSMKKKPEKVFVVHGESEACESFVQCLKEEVGLDAHAPYTGEIYDLAENVCLTEGCKEMIKKKEKIRRASTVSDRLMAAGTRLLAVIRHNEGGANKDLARFADQIQSLCDKWDR